MGGWLSSLQALQRLRSEGLTRPEDTLSQWAEARQLRTRAKWGRFSDDDIDVREFPDEPEVREEGEFDPDPWPDIPCEFWRWVNTIGQRTEANFESGVFAANVIYDPLLGSHSDTQHIELFGVTFHEGDFESLIHGVGQTHASASMERPGQSKAGRKPQLWRWAEFGAALAFIANTRGLDTLKSQDATYRAASDALTEAGFDPLDQRRVAAMVRYAIHWVDAEKVSQPDQA